MAILLGAGRAHLVPSLRRRGLEAVRGRLVRVGPRLRRAARLLRGACVGGGRERACALPGRRASGGHGGLPVPDRAGGHERRGEPTPSAAEYVTILPSPQLTPASSSS
jgi:hypothetical protein